MTSAPVRDPLAGHLLRPENAVFLFTGYQPAQLAAVRSVDHALLLKNAAWTVRTIKTFGVPVVPSTVNAGPGLARCAVARQFTVSKSRAKGIMMRRIATAAVAVLAASLAGTAAIPAAARATPTSITLRSRCWNGELTRPRAVPRVTAALGPPPAQRNGEGDAVCQV